MNVRQALTNRVAPDYQQSHCFTCVRWGKHSMHVSVEDNMQGSFSPTFMSSSYQTPQGLHDKHLYPVSQLGSSVKTFDNDKNQLCVFVFPSFCLHLGCYL